MTRPSVAILLVDDHTLFRESLRRLLAAEPGYTVAGDFSTAVGALAALDRGLRYDVALIDYDLMAGDGGDGLDLLREMRRRRPDARVLMVTAGMEPIAMHAAIGQLRAGLFLKTEPTAELLLAIDRMARGERWISSGAALNLLADAPAQPAEPAGELFTLRETAVLRSVLEGLSNKQIAARLDLTESGVKAVLQKLFDKTGVRSRSQLVRYALEAEID